MPDVRDIGEEEHQIARLQVGSRHVHTRVPLVSGVMRERDSFLGEGPHDQPGAVKLRPAPPPPRRRGHRAWSAPACKAWAPTVFAVGMVISGYWPVCVKIAIACFMAELLTWSIFAWMACFLVFSWAAALVPPRAADRPSAGRAASWFCWLLSPLTTSPLD